MAAKSRRHGPKDHKDRSEIRHCPETACDEAWNNYVADDSTVYCDEMCGAKDNPPRVIWEWKKAAIHWRYHEEMGGCSHGH